jgi:2'-5' RNA ligase
MTDHRPLILTALFEPETQARFQRLRDSHFPPERNIVPAHLTLFHHLPGGEIDAVRGRLSQIGRLAPPPRADVVGLRSLGKGVAFTIRAPELEAVRAELADAWATLLIPQDRQGWRPHVTVQNKARPDEARALLTALEAGFSPWTAHIVALRLWRYLDGPWEALGEVRFRG